MTKELKKQISWMPRYSSTDEPDKFGRWARIAMFRSLKIAWIDRVVIPGAGVVYHLDTFFPSSSSDLPFNSSVHETFIEAAETAENLWVAFLDHCR